jgi:hypothetical protein
MIKLKNQSKKSAYQKYIILGGQFFKMLSISLFFFEIIESMALVSIFYLFLKNYLILKTGCCFYLI